MFVLNFQGPESGWDFLSNPNGQRTIEFGWVLGRKINNIVELLALYEGMNLEKKLKIIKI